MIDWTQINTLVNATTVEELWDHHTAQMAEFGFDRIMYGFTRYCTESSLGDPEDFILLTNHDPEYIEGFIGRRLYFDAPMVRWALENEGACSWSVLRDQLKMGRVSERACEVLEFNRRYGVTAGYSISFKSVTPRSKGAIALTARRDMEQCEVDEIWRRSGDQIHALNNIVHLCLQTLPVSSQGRALTQRQREVLAWVADGKTTRDIAVLMGLTPTTVEKHLRLARQALNVETTAQAVLKAALHNQMFQLET